MHCEGLLDNYDWQIRQNNQYTKHKSQQRPLLQVHKSKKKISGTCNNSEAVIESDDEVNVRFTLEQLNFLAWVRTRIYQDRQRFDQQKISIITSKEIF